MDDHSDLVWKTVLNSLSFLPLLNIYPLSGHDLIRFTIVIRATSTKIRRHVAECQLFLMNESACSWALCFSEQWVPFLALRTTAAHQRWPQGTFSSPHLARKMSTYWLNDNKPLLLWHGWQVESRIKRHWVLLHNTCTIYVLTEEMPILHFNGLI